MKLAPGKSPIVLTFHQIQLNLIRWRTT